MRFIVLFAIALSAFVTKESASCSCAPRPPPGEAAKNADALFYGQIIGSALADTNVRHYFIKVSDIFKGAEEKEKTVSTALTGAECGYDFILGRYYTIYALKRNGIYYTNICSRTVEGNKEFNRLIRHNNTSGNDFAISRKIRELLGGIELTSVDYNQVAVEAVLKEAKMGINDEVRKVIPLIHLDSVTWKSEPANPFLNPEERRALVDQPKVTIQMENPKLLTLIETLMKQADLGIDYIREGPELIYLYPLSEYKVEQ